MEYGKNFLLGLIIFVLLMSLPAIAGDQIVLRIGDEGYTKTDIIEKESLLKKNINKIVEIRKAKGIMFKPNWTSDYKINAEYIRHLDFMIVTTDSYINNTAYKKQNFPEKNLTNKSLINKELLVQNQVLEKENIELEEKLKQIKESTIEKSRIDELQATISKLEKDKIAMEKENSILKKQSNAENKTGFNPMIIWITILLFINLILITTIFFTSKDNKDIKLTIKDKDDTIKILKQINKDHEKKISQVIIESEEKINKLKADIASNDNNFRIATKESQQIQKENMLFKSENDKLKVELGEKVKNLGKKSNEIKILDAKMSLKDSEILDRSNKILELKDEIKKIQENITHVNTEDVDDMIESKDGKVITFPKKKEAI